MTKEIPAGVYPSSRAGTGMTAGVAGMTFGRSEGEPPPFTLILKIQMEIAPAFQGMQSILNEIPCLGIVTGNGKFLGINIL